MTTPEHPPLFGRPPSRPVARRRAFSGSGGELEVRHADRARPTRWCLAAVPSCLLCQASLLLDPVQLLLNLLELCLVLPFQCFAVNPDHQFPNADEPANVYDHQHPETTNDPFVPAHPHSIVLALGRQREILDHQLDPFSILVLPHHRPHFLDDPRGHPVGDHLLRRVPCLDRNFSVCNNNKEQNTVASVVATELPSIEQIHCVIHRFLRL
mmetsp:Transcript_33145/g.68413  ORF Transcript_33145/g.68413 Transcript_33145/m.68413 type:complete len:211 (-) Transcript_33145:301-933(-)